MAGVDKALRRYQYEQLTEQDMKTVLARPRIDLASILSTVRFGSTCHWHKLLGNAA